MIKTWQPPSGQIGKTNDFVGQDVAAEELVDNFVPREHFVQEASELLEGAVEMQKELEGGIQSGYAGWQLIKMFQHVSNHTDDTDTYLKFVC